MTVYEHDFESGYVAGLLATESEPMEGVFYRQNLDMNASWQAGYDIGYRDTMEVEVLEIDISEGDYQ